jgi:hypothetical protein
MEKNIQTKLPWVVERARKANKPFQAWKNHIRNEILDNNFLTHKLVYFHFPT